MNTNDGKQNQKPPAIPAATRKVKGERQKAKGENDEVKGERQKAKDQNDEVKGERQKAKYQSAKPKAKKPEPKVESKNQAVTPVPHDVNSPVKQSVPETHKSEIGHPTSEIDHKSDIEHPKHSLERSEKSPIVHKSEIEHPKSEISMEVHHHPQLDHNPKPFKEYLLEGLMIFIAVMMGFIAENVREYIDNNEHAHQLCVQLVQDLKADTANLNNINDHVAVIGRQNDSLFNILQQPLASVNAKEMLLLVNDSHSTWPFHPTGGAIEAIKNELQLKQFSKSDIISYIATYEGHIALMHTAQDIALQCQRLYTDPFMLRYFSPRDLDSVLGRKPLGNVQVHNLTQADMTQMAGEMALVQVITHEQVRDCVWLKQDAKNMLQYVQSHFDVE